MDLYTAHRNFKIELDKSDVSSYPSFLPEEIDYWYNTAILRIVKAKSFGSNLSRSGFQQNQKRTDDLRTLVSTFCKTVSKFSIGTAYLKDDIVIDGNKYYISNENHTASNLSKFTACSIDNNCLYINYPSDYMNAVGENVYIYSLSTCWPKDDSNNPIQYRSGVTECTIENIDSRLSNSLSDHILNGISAKPLRLYSDNKIYIYTDGNYNIGKYCMNYIKIPEKLDWYKVVKGNFADDITYYPGDVVRHESKYYKCITMNDQSNFDENNFILLANLNSVNTVVINLMPDHMWDEITSLAVRLALENIADQRYQTYGQESQLVE